MKRDFAFVKRKSSGHLMLLFPGKLASPDIVLVDFKTLPLTFICFGPKTLSQILYIKLKLT